MSKVLEYLAARRLKFDAFDHPRTFTAIEEAEALGLGPHTVAKAVLLDTSAGHALAVVAAPHRLDLELVGKAVGDPDVRIASEVEMRRDFPDYEVGTLPPVPSLVSMPVFVDTELAAHERLVFASGRQTESVRMRTQDLLNELNVTVAPLGRPMESFDEDWIE